MEKIIVKLSDDDDFIEWFTNELDEGEIDALDLYESKLAFFEKVTQKLQADFPGVIVRTWDGGRVQVINEDDSDENEYGLDADRVNDIMVDIYTQNDFWVKKDF